MLLLHEVVGSVIKEEGVCNRCKIGKNCLKQSSVGLYSAGLVRALNVPMCILDLVGKL